MKIVASVAMRAEAVRAARAIVARCRARASWPSRLATVLLGLAAGSASGDVSLSGAEWPLPVRRTVESLPDDPDLSDRLTRLFAQAVLRDEGGREIGVKKWDRPVQIAVTGPWRDHQDLLSDLARQLTRLAGLPVTFVTDRSVAVGIDVRLRVTRPWPFGEPPPAAQRPPALCAAAFGWERGAFRHATIEIDTGRLDPPTIRACLVEEIVQCFGLLGETRAEVDTLLSDQVGYAGIGAIDRVLLRTLYDPRLVPGMTTGEALPIARERIIREIAAARAREGP